MSRSQRVNSSKRVFITGGVSGLGRSLALHYAHQGSKVCIADLNDERGASVLNELKAAGAGDAIYLHVDVTKEADLQTAAERIQQEWDGLDLLFNNAGVAGAGAIDEVALSDWQWILDINLLGVVRGCKAFVPMFKAQGHGHIVNIASMAGLLDVPLMASYNVSKAAVVALSGTLEHELMGDGIDVSVACPGFFKTNLNESVRSTNPQLTKIMNRLLEKGPLDVDQVADHIVRAVEKKQVMIFPHKSGRRTWTAKRFMPQGVYRQFFQRSIAPMQSAATGKR